MGTVASFSVLFLVYAGFSTVGYLAFGQDVDPNILKNLPSGPWGNASRICYVMVIMASYPMFLYPLASSIRNSDGLRSRGVNVKLVSHVAIVVVVASVMVAAMILDDLGTLNAVVGAVQCAVFVGVGPGLVGLFLLGPRSMGACWKMLMVVLIVMCSVIGGLGVIYTHNYAEELPEHCSWKMHGLNTPSGAATPIIGTLPSSSFVVFGT